MATPILLLASVAVLAILFVAIVPRLLLGRSQDRLAKRLLEAAGGRLKLLTRAEMVVGKYRRVPGVLGLSEDAVTFQGLFGETQTLPTAQIQKIVTGRRLASGRRLVRLEVLRVTRTGGEELALVMAPASASAWRSHLGLWAVQERKAAMDTVTPGRSGGGSASKGSTSEKGCPMR